MKRIIIFEAEERYRHVCGENICKFNCCNYHGFVIIEYNFQTKKYEKWETFMTDAAWKFVQEWDELPHHEIKEYMDNSKYVCFLYDEEWVVLMVIASFVKNADCILE